MAQAAPLIPTASRFRAASDPHSTQQGACGPSGSRSSSPGPTAEEAARALARGLGGAVVEDDPHAFRVEGSPLGDIAVELDSRFLHPEKKGRRCSEAILPQIAAWFGSAASYLIPCELVTAPIPVDRLHEVDRVVEILRDVGRQGHPGRSLLCLRAALQPGDPAPRRGDGRRLPEELRPAQRLAPAPGGARHDPPPPRIRRSVSAGLCPRCSLRPTTGRTCRAFIDDYLAANPTRNRDLDLLPLLLHLRRAARCARLLPNEKINATPDLPLSPARTRG